MLNRGSVVVLMVRVRIQEKEVLCVEIEERINYVKRELFDDLSCAVSTRCHSTWICRYKRNAVIMFLWGLFST